MNKMKHGKFQKRKKRKIEHCTSCGIFGDTTISWNGLWAIGCGLCRKGYASKWLWLALYRWNKAARKQLKKIRDEARLKRIRDEAR